MSVETGLKKKISLSMVFVLLVVLFSFQMTGVASEGTNIALDKPSTCQGFTAGHNSSLANDNNEESYWEGTKAPTWWMVDLGAFYDLNEIRIVNEANRPAQQKAAGKATYKYTIYSSPDNVTWYKAAEKSETKEMSPAGETYQVYATLARYVKVDMGADSAITSIRDFKVYGTPSSDPGLGIGEGKLAESRITYPVTTGVTRTVITRGYNNGAGVATTTSGPWLVHVLTVDPETYEGKVQARLCGDKVSGVKTVPGQAIQDNAIAAINGSFFCVAPTFNGTIGGSMGLFAVDGKLTNESIRDRGAMLIPEGTVKGIRIGRFSTIQTAFSSNGSKIVINGINRMPGVKVGVTANYEPLHDTETQFRDEVILYTDMLGKTTEKRLAGYQSFGGTVKKVALFDDSGAEAVIGANGIVKELYNSVGGHTVPTGGKILAGIGAGADWIRAYATVGSSINIDTTLTCDGYRLSLPPKASIMSAGPVLMKDGVATTKAEWYAEGFKNDTWNARNPRSLVGTKADGTFLIVLVDGRKDNISCGATLAELESIMGALGASEALNLDGGKSSVMTIGGEIVNSYLLNREVGDILELLQ